MHHQTVILLLVGLSVSAYGLDLSHAAKHSTKLEPHLPSLVRERDLTEAEMRSFTDAFTQALNDVFTNVIQKPLEDALAGGALMLAQVLAGLGTSGVNLSSIFGKRDLTEAELRGIFDTVTGAVVSGIQGVWNNVLQVPLQNFVQNSALVAAGWFANFGTNGVNLGKRDLTEAEMRSFTDALTQALNDVFTNVIQKPLEDALAGGALMLAQVLAGLGTTGVDLSSIFGKRDLTEAELRGIFDTVTGAVVSGIQGVWNNVLQVPLQNFVQNSALVAAGWFANFGTNGVNLGKRSNEARGQILDNLVGHASGLYATQVKPVVESALNAAVAHLAGVLANFSQNGLGRR